MSETDFDIFFRSNFWAKKNGFMEEEKSGFLLSGRGVGGLASLHP